MDTTGRNAKAIKEYGKNQLQKDVATDHLSLKEFTDPYVKIFVQNGLSGFFNRYHATGGLSNGRLGGISSIRPDYQTDLIVTFVPCE